MCFRCFESIRKLYQNVACNYFNKVLFWKKLNFPELAFVISSLSDRWSHLPLHHLRSRGRKLRFKCFEAIWKMNQNVARNYFNKVLFFEKVEFIFNLMSESLPSRRHCYCRKWLEIWMVTRNRPIKRQLYNFINQVLFLEKWYFSAISYFLRVCWRYALTLRQRESTDWFNLSKSFSFFSRNCSKTTINVCSFFHIIRYKRSWRSLQQSSFSKKPEFPWDLLQIAFLVEYRRGHRFPWRRWRDEPGLR